MNIAALRHRDFRAYFFGNVFGLNGVWMLRLTTAWLAWEMTGTASFVGFVAFLFFAPTMVSGPFFGVLIDRVSVKRAALVTQSAQFCLSGLLLLSHLGGALGPLVLSVLAAAIGFVGSAHAPVRMSLAPRLVPREAVSSVVAMTTINFNLARMTGPAIAGWIIATWGVGVSMLVQTLCVLPFIAALSTVTPREKEVRAGARPSFLSDLLSGFRLAFLDPAVRRPILVTGIFAFVIRGSLELLPVVADGTFGKGAAGLGVITAASGLGAISAGFLVAMLPAQTTSALPLRPLAITLAGTASVALLGILDVWEMVQLLVVWLAFAGTISGITMQTAIQVDLDDDMRGRVMSIWAMIGIGGAALGAAGLGLLTDLVGFRATMIGAGMLGATGLGWLLAKALSER